MPKEQEDVVNEHMEAVLKHDREALAEGYADDGVMLYGPAPIVGKAAIRAMFDSLPDEAFPSEVTIDSMLSHGEYVFVTYHSGEIRGGDTFHVRDGKIVLQTAFVVTD